MALDDYVGLQDLADFMLVDTLPQSLAELQLAAAMQSVRKYLDQDITFVADDVEYHDGRSRDKVRLRQRPVREVTSVVVDDEVIDPSEYVVRGAVIQFLNGTGWPTWRWNTNNIVVTYDHGWDASLSDPMPVPADIRLATLSTARRRLMNSGETNETLASETIGKYSYTRDSAAGSDAFGLLPAETAVLDRYAVRLYL